MIAYKKSLKMKQQEIKKQEIIMTKLFKIHTIWTRLNKFMYQTDLNKYINSSFGELDSILQNIYGSIDESTIIFDKQIIYNKFIDNKFFQQIHDSYDFLLKIS